jgi:hypothetical protein
MAAPPSTLKVEPAEKPLTAESAEKPPKADPPEKPPKADPPEKPPKVKAKRRILLSKLDTSKIPSVISIFGVEHFKLDTCLSRDIETNKKTTQLCEGDVKEADPTLASSINRVSAEANAEAAAEAAAEAESKAKGDAKGEANAKGEDAAKPPTEPTEDEPNPLTELSGYLGKNMVTTQNNESFVYKTRKEFETLYLHSNLTKVEKKLMIKVFRFIFGNIRSIVQREHLEKLLTPFDKVPCKEGDQKPLWEMFKACLTYRIYGSTGNADAEPETKAAAESKPNTEPPAATEPETKAATEPETKAATEPKAEPEAAAEPETKTEPKANAATEAKASAEAKPNTKPKAKGSMGLNAELASLQRILPHDNEEFKNKQFLRAQLLRMIAILDENRTCVVFSGTGANIVLSEYHTAILDLIRKTVKRSLQDKVPVTDEEKEEHFKALMKELKELKPKDESNRAIYDDMISVVGGIFDTIKANDEKLDSVKGVFATLDTLVQQLSTQKGGGGGAEADAEAEDAEEEYERVYTTAMGHLQGKKEFLDEVCELLGGTDLDSSIEHAVRQKGFNLHATMARLHELDTTKHTKSFLRCVETLLEIKEQQYAVYDPPPPLTPGQQRYSYTMSQYPSLKQYIPKNLRSKDLKSLEKVLRRVYPYTDTLLEDITILRKEANPCCLFYKGVLASLSARKITKVRKACKKIVDTIPNCEHLLEEVLTLVSKEEGKGLVFKQVTLPKGFSLLAEAIREGLPPVPSFPITIHEQSPKEFQVVLGESPFLLLGSGTVMKGIKGYEIDVADDLPAIRKGEITVGQIMLVYLYIKCDSDIDA